MKSMKKNFFDTRKLVIYLGSLVLPLLGIVPLLIRFFGLNKWCMLGCLCAAFVAVLIMATTTEPGKRKWAVSLTIAFTVVMAVMVGVARWIPIPPLSFFVCYYVVDILAITISIVINIISISHNSSYNQRGVL